ncbi:MAG: DUF4339 domain-containing protein [Planctomycetes bacterium]|nr:DUF4339 domain-containing protein [Planctomycetota bacterium]
MGIRFYCPDCGRRLNIKAFLAGKRGICPHCDSRVLIPMESQLPSDAPKHRPTSVQAAATPVTAGATAPANAPSADPVIQQPSPEPISGENPSDPIGESPDSVWYVRPSAGGQYGPARGDVMRRWLTEGRVTADSMVWREGWEDWKLAAPVFPSLETTPSTKKLDPVTPVPSFLVPDDEEQDISKPVAAPARRVTSKKKSIAPLIILGLLIVVLLVVTVVILQSA